MPSHSDELAMNALDLQLLQTASYFDLTSRDSRKASTVALRELFLCLHTIVLPRTIFEIGAREASFAQAVRQHLPTADIYAFEASPHNYEHFVQTIGVGELRIHYRHLAVTDRSGTASFFVQKSRKGKPISPTTGNNSILRRRGKVEQEAVTVEAVSIADFVTANGLAGPYSAWIDVEGANRNVLLGMEPHLAQFVLLHCEVEDSAHWEAQWLWPDVLRFLTSRGFVPVARDFEFDDQNNVVFVRSDLLAVPVVRLAIARHYAALKTGTSSPGPSPSRSP